MSDSEPNMTPSQSRDATLRDGGIVPYYRDDSCTIYNADCLEILPLITYDVIVTDPPYGTGWMKGGGRVGEFKARGEKEEWDKWDASWIDVVKERAKCIACFCPDVQIADLLSRLSPVRWRYYVKTNPRPPLNGNDTPSVEPIAVWPRVRFSRGPAHMEAYNGDAEHPCEKPIKIMAWLLTGCVDLSEVVCDPFAGGGSTLVAAKLMGNRAIGIEREERYCEIAARRLAQEVLNFTPRQADAALRVSDKDGGAKAPASFSVQGLPEKSPESGNSPGFGPAHGSPQRGQRCLAEHSAHHSPHPPRVGGSAPKARVGENGELTGDFERSVGESREGTK